MANREEIIARVKALRAKADCEGATEAEAMQAAEMAAKLLTKHDITPEELRDIKKSDATMDGFRQGKVLHPVLDHAADAISQFTETTCFQWGGEVKYVGIDSDVFMAVYLSELLVGTAKRLWREHHATLPKRMKFDAVTKARNSLYIGFGARISARLLELHRERLANRDKAHGTALVVTKDQLIKELLDENGIHLMDPEPRDHIDLDIQSYMTGRAAADTVQLDRPLGESNRQEALL